MSLGAVVLDMDGLMLDTEPVYKSSWQQACAELGFHLSDEEYEPYIGRPTGDCEPELAEFFGPSFPLERFRGRWPELWESVIRENGVAQKPGLEMLLSFLEAQNVVKAVATSTASEYTKLTLRSGGVDPGRFAAIVTRDQVPNGKPAPDLYLEAARRLGVDPRRCMALEDSDAGTLSAAAAGMRAICIPDLKPPSEAARRPAWRVVPSLRDAQIAIKALLGVEKG